MDKKKKFGQKLASLAEGSLILSFFNAVSLFFAGQAKSGIFGSLFTGYRREDSEKLPSFFEWLFMKIGKEGRILSPLRKGIARKIENSLILSFCSSVFRGMLRISLRFYGIFTFFFSLYTCSIALLKHFALHSAPLFGIDLMVGIALILLSVPCMAVSRCVCDCIKGSRLLSLFLFDFLGIRRASFSCEGTPRGKSNVAIIAGMLFGAMTFFVPPLVFVAAFFGILFLYELLVFPESGVVLIFFLLPFVPTLPLGVFTLFVFFCYVMKLIRSKRTFKFEPIDLAVLLFAVFLFCGGFVSVSSASLKPALMFLCFLSGYFLTVNLIRSTEWVKRVLFSLTSSCLIVSLLGILQKLTGSVSTVWQDTEMFSYIDGRITSTLENPNVLAEYLVMVFPLFIAVFLTAKGGWKKGLSLLPIGLVGLAIVYTWSRGAWLGMMIGMVIFLLLFSRHTLTFLLFSLCAVPFLPFVLPSGIIDRITSIGNLADSSTAYRTFIWQAAVKMFGDALPAGIGIGEGAFSVVYPKYALAGIETAPHSHNLFLQIGIEVGLPGLVTFLAVIFLFARCAVSLGTRGEDRRNAAFALAGFGGILSVLAQGMTDYVWYNYRVFFLFWLLIGLVTAMAKIGCHPASSEENAGFLQIDFPEKG